MFRQALAGAVIMLLSGSNSSAQIDLAWRNCTISKPSEPSSVSNETFSCDLPQVFKLHGTLRVPFTLTGVGGFEASLDFQSEARDTPPFWHFEPLGCNQAGLAILDDKSSSGGCADYATIWGDHGERSFAFMDYYATPWNGIPNRARLLLTIAYDFANYLPYPTLDSSVRYYAFHLTFDTANAQSCSGCNQPVAIVWNSVTIGNADHPPVTLSGPDQGTSCATINGATPSTCQATPTRNATWGSIKSLYR